MHGSCIASLFWEQHACRCMDRTAPASSGSNTHAMHGPYSTSLFWEQHARDAWVVHHQQQACDAMHESYTVVQPLGATRVRCMDCPVVQPMGATSVRCSPLPERSIFVTRRLAASSATGTVVRSCNHGGWGACAASQARVRSPALLCGPAIMAVGGRARQSDAQLFFTRWDAAYYMNYPYHMHPQRFLEGGKKAFVPTCNRTVVIEVVFSSRCP
jgi:hypothetical protein